MISITGAERRLSAGFRRMTVAIPYSTTTLNSG